MSDPKDKVPMKLPAEPSSGKINEPPDTDDPFDDDDDSEGQPDQPDGEK